MFVGLKQMNGLQVCGQRILASRGANGALGAARSYTSLVAPFYVFPCEHAFHAQCLTEYVIKHTDKSEVGTNVALVYINIKNAWYQFSILIMVSKNLLDQYHNCNTSQILILGGYHKRREYHLNSQVIIWVNTILVPY